MKIFQNQQNFVRKNILYLCINLWFKIQITNTDKLDWIII